MRNMQVMIPGKEGFWGQHSSGLNALEDSGESLCVSQSPVRSIILPSFCCP
jgi:hypothetical protein